MSISPAAFTDLLPPCLFHAATGWDCPLCGMTRGVTAVLRLDLAAAVGYNVFAPVAVLLAAWLAIRWIRRRTSISTKRAGVAPPRWLTVGLPVVLVAFTIVRNLPGMGALRA